MSDKDLKIYLGCRQFTYKNEGLWESADGYVARKVYGQTVINDDKGNLVANNLPEEPGRYSSIFVETGTDKFIHLIGTDGTDAAGNDLNYYRAKFGCNVYRPIAPGHNWEREHLGPKNKRTGCYFDELPHRCAERKRMEGHKTNTPFLGSPHGPGRPRGAPPKGHR